MASGLHKLGKRQLEIIKIIFECGNIQGLNTNSKNRQERYRNKKIISNLENRGFITLGKEKVLLTKKGKKIINTLNQSEINIKAHKWDGVWRVIAYDIPNTKRSERDYLRIKLKEWNFKLIQKSLWAIPYECKEELAIFCNEYNIGNYVIYLETTKIPNEHKIIKYYNLDK